MSLRPEILLTFIAMLLVTFGSRYAGLMLRGDLPPFWMRFLRFVPIAVFAALIVPEISGTRRQWLARVLAALLGALTAWYTRQLWVTVIVGMLAFALLNYVL